MGGQIDRIYETLVTGAEKGLSDKALFDHVLGNCPKATSKKIVKASLLALTDPDLRDANILHVIYALAIKHRLDPLLKKDLTQGDEPLAENSQIKKRIKS